jgi:hypothetical protein
MVFGDHAKREGVKPVYVALAIAIVGLLALLIGDHGPWNRAHVQPAHLAYHKTTGEAARAAGADIAPTTPQSALEPEPLVPKPIEPVNPQAE